MSCYGNTCYLPQPTRVWSRVQNSCSYITNIDSSGLVKVPLTNEIVPASELLSKVQMLKKGNILQYKTNATCLSKAQKYSLIAKKLWVNRNITWATQSTKGYTNPNSTSLKRTGNVINVKIDNKTGDIIGSTYDPITCTTKISPVYNILPSVIIGEANGNPNPPNPPTITPTEASETFPSVQPVITTENTTVIQDGGSLVCSMIVNECTGFIKNTKAQQLCHPSSDSDVPGPIIDLCWNDGIEPWFPRQPTVMSNSANKWPYSSGGIGNNFIYDSAIKPSAPIITNIETTNNIVSLTWEQPTSCLPILNYHIYQNGIKIKIVESNVFTTNISINNFEVYSFFIIAYTNGSVQSPASNIVTTNNSNLDAPVIVSIDINNENIFPSIILTWEPVDIKDNNKLIEISYNVYLNNELYLNDVTSPFEFEYLEKNKTYLVGIQAVVLVPETDRMNYSTINNEFISIPI